ncbi:RNA polymerase III subunit Rpc25-domain-containing protein [Calycina marina]|uniref:DNA-directed RNA polymerase subunit n=1 Tax=Calycina marina TaxID=1763456 RepID=A0A9P7Z634_9HELO|nr:RNA polymerase III subunit Rpc25-domain-containing protein [Calycina marina]
MFILTKIADLVQIEPKHFSPFKPGYQALADNINAKYANKVIQKIGHCICLYDILASSDGLIGSGTGLVNVNVEFRLIVFRPFKGEVMIGRISSATVDGIYLRTHFFEDIWVPKGNLPEGSYYSPHEGCWVWKTGDAELFFDTQETVRFRVDEEDWHDQTPISAQPPSNEDDFAVKEKDVPYKIIATMEDAGLGPCLWWDGDDPMEEDA